ncbi:BON domain-containing protein [Mucilaginibacter sp. HD30]
MKTGRTIQKEVMAALDAEPNLDIANIGVSVNQGVVTLSGRVTSYSQKITAQQAVWHVPGVRAFVDQLDLILPFEEKFTDAIIAEKILQTLDSFSTITNYHLRLNVDQGRAQLKGEVDSEDEKQKAINSVWNLPYVKDIIDMIAVRTGVAQTQSLL